MTCLSSNALILHTAYLLLQICYTARMGSYCLQTPVPLSLPMVSNGVGHKGEFLGSLVQSLDRSRTCLSSSLHNPCVTNHSCMFVAARHSTYVINLYCLH